MSHNSMISSLVFYCVSIYSMLLLQPALCLKMQDIQLSFGKDFLRVQEPQNSILECRFDLKEGEEVGLVSWYKDDLVAYIWTSTPAVPKPQIVGLMGLEKEDVVQFRAQDGHLEFARVHPDQAGRYRCEVTTKAASTYKSFEYQLLVIDMPILPEHVESSVESCEVKFSWQAPPISPKPTPKCGVFSLEHGYILTAANWMATPYYNGSIGYGIHEEEFHIRQMPLDSAIRCEVGVTKIDKSHISLIDKMYNFTQIWERGCHPLEVSEGVDLDYKNDRPTCHTEMVPEDNTQKLTSEVKCKDGYMPKYPDLVTNVQLMCVGLKWEVMNNMTWNHYDNLICVEETEAPKPPPTSDHKPKMMATPVKAVRASDLSNGSWKSHIGIWLPILVLGGLTLSAFICKNTRTAGRKDPRLMA